MLCQPESRPVEIGMISPDGHELHRDTEAYEKKGSYLCRLQLFQKKHFALKSSRPRGDARE